MLPPELKHRAEYVAREEGVSLGELIGKALEARLAKRTTTRDPFFAQYEAFAGDVPSDLAENHDKYLYDEE